MDMTAYELETEGTLIVDYWPNRISYKKVFEYNDYVYSVTYVGQNGPYGIKGDCNTCYPYEIVVKEHGHKKYFPHRLHQSTLNAIKAKRKENEGASFQQQKSV